MEITFTEVIKWIIIVFIAAFIGYFGKRLGEWIIGKVKKEKQEKARSPEEVKAKYKYKLEKQKLKLKKKKLKNQ